MSRRHEWTTERSSPGLLRWQCHLCGDEQLMTWVSAADPERLRSMAIVLDSVCPGQRRLPIVKPVDIDLALAHLREPKKR